MSRSDGGFTLAEQSKRIAFTLAEVLITLGIIGVVAALTIPTLIQNHQKTIIETRLKKFYSAINQAVNLSVIDNGPVESWYTANNKNCTEGSDNEKCLVPFFKTYLAPYLNYSKYEPSKNNYFSIVYFADGSAMRLTYYGHNFHFYPVAKKFETKNIYGRDQFVFALYPDSDNINYKNKGVEPGCPSNWDGSYEILKTNKDWAAKLIQMNNWKIPDDYPWLK